MNKALSKKFIVFTAILFCGQLLHAQSGFFKNFGKDQGLPTNKIQCINQGNEGFLWIGTNNGLSRFDGYQFRNYQNQLEIPTSISSDNILQIEPDSEELLWLGHYEDGVDLFDSKTGKKIFNLNEASKENKIPDNRITKLWLEKSKDRLWICTTKNMWVWYDKKLKKIIKPTINKSKNNTRELPNTNSIYDIVQSPQNKNQYWLATNDGLVLYEEKESEVTYFNFDKASLGLSTYDKLRSIIINNDDIWIGSRGGSALIKFNISTKTHQKFNTPFSSKEDMLVLDISQKSKNEIWIGTIGHSLGIFNTDTHTYSFFSHKPTINSSIIDGSIYNIYKDLESNFWIVSNKGLSLYSPQYQYFKKTNLPFQKNKEIQKPLSFIDDKENIYIGLSATNSLLIYNKSTQKFSTSTPINPEQTNNNILRLYKDTQENIWIVAGAKILKYSPKIKKLERLKLPDCTKSLIFHSIYIDSDEKVYLGTRFNGLFTWDQKTNTCDSITREINSLVHNRFLHEIIEDKNGRLWLSTERGISVINKTTGKVLKNFGKELGYKVVYRLAIDSKGTVYGSSENKGVYTFNSLTLKPGKSITKIEGLPSNAIQHIAIDKNDNLWIATQLGLAKYNVSDKVLQLFDDKNGLTENHLEASLNRLSEGSMIQGFEDGFSVFKPDLFGGQLKLKPPKIITFKVFDEDMPVRQEIVLKADQNYFTIAFSVLDFANAANIKYAYRLKGANQDWIIPNKSRDAVYTNIEAGRYIFEVKSAFIGTNVWSPITKLTVIIKPPFYKTLWFLGIVLTFFSALGYFLYKQKIKQVKDNENRKNEINKQLLNSELRALRSQMNPHFLYNCINSIKFYIIKNEPDQASTYLNKFSKLIRKILNNSQFEFISLEEEIQTIELYVEMEKLRFGDKMNYIFEIDPNLEISFLKIPTMLLQPFIENAIWHGIMQKNNSQGMLKLRFYELGEDKISIEIEDNGVGRAKSAELKSKSLNKNKSLGLEMTSQRVKNLNEMNNAGIEIKTLDLFDENNEACGTAIRITMNAMTIN